MPTGVPPSILVAEDQTDIRDLLVMNLRSAGYEVSAVGDGEQALARQLASPADLLVLDLMMPRMTGFDVLAGLRDMGEARPRVIVLSARGREEDVIRAFALGADDFVAKPFNPHELLARIARLVK